MQCICHDYLMTLMHVNFLWNKSFCHHFLQFETATFLLVQPSCESWALLFYSNLGHFFILFCATVNQKELNELWIYLVHFIGGSKAMFIVFSIFSLPSWYQSSLFGRLCFNIKTLASVSKPPWYSSYQEEL